jgi:hypothetical protein
MTDLLVRLRAMVSDTSGEFIGTTPAPPSGDRVELTDLEVIQRWSLAVRGASADRADVVAALRADLAWLERGRTQETPRASTRASTAGKTTAKKPAAKKTTTSRGGTRRR